MVVSKALQGQIDLRNQRILQMHELGYSFAIIADAEKMTPQRVSQIIKELKEKENEGS